MSNELIERLRKFAKQDSDIVPITLSINTQAADAIQSQAAEIGIAILRNT